MYDLVDDQPKTTQTTQNASSTAQEQPSQEPRAQEIRRMSEFSMELHGKDHPDALFRAANGGANQRIVSASGGAEGIVLFGCPCCGRTVKRVIRVRPTRKSAWSAVCAMCAAATLAQSDEAVIGGVVRTGRRRRREKQSYRNAG